MSIIRIFKCDSCGYEQTEKFFGAGVKGWMQLNGVALDGVENPHLCPKCKQVLQTAFDEKAKEAKQKREVA